MIISFFLNSVMGQWLLIAFDICLGLPHWLHTDKRTHGRAPSPAPPALHTQAGSRCLLENAEIDSPRKPSLICEEVKIDNGLEMTSLSYWSRDSWEGTGEGAWGRGGSTFPHKEDSTGLTRLKRTLQLWLSCYNAPGWG